MNQQQNPTSGFEDRLLSELRAVVAERGVAEAEAEVNSPVVPAWRRGPRLALAGGAVAALAAAVLIVNAGGEDTPAAYAVEAQPDGQVSVEIRSLSDASGLERALAEAGVPARVDYVATGMACKEPRYQPVTAAIPAEPADEGPAAASKVTSSIQRSDNGATVFSISRDVVGPGQTLVLTAAPGPSGNGDSLQMAVAEGAVRACQPVRAPAGVLPADVPEDGAPKGGPASDAGPSTSRAGEPGAAEHGLSTGGAH